jgi:hypothetical protein
MLACCCRGESVSHRVDAFAKGRVLEAEVHRQVRRAPVAAITNQHLTCVEPRKVRDTEENASRSGAPVEVYSESLSGSGH